MLTFTVVDHGPSLIFICFRDGSEDGLTFAFRFTDATVSISNQGMSGELPKQQSILSSRFGFFGVLLHHTYLFSYQSCYLTNEQARKILTAPSSLFWFS